MPVHRDHEILGHYNPKLDKQIHRITVYIERQYKCKPFRRKIVKAFPGCKIGFDPVTGRGKWCARLVWHANKCPATLKEKPVDYAYAVFYDCHDRELWRSKLKPTP